MTDYQLAAHQPPMLSAPSGTCNDGNWNDEDRANPNRFISTTATS